MKKTLITFLSGTYILVSPAWLLAQNPETVPVPPEPMLPEAENPRLLGNPDLSDGSAGREDFEILPELLGITLRERTDENVVKEAVEIPVEVQERLDQFPGQPLRLSTLAILKGEITDGFEDANGDLVRATVPEQDVTDGFLKLDLVRAKVGKVSVEESRWFRDEIYIRNLDLTPGSQVNSDTLSSNLEWLNRNPYRSVFAVYEGGSAFGTTDIIVRPFEVRPWTVFAGYDNDGTELLGQDRWSFGIQHGNLAGTDARLLYQYYTDTEFENSSGHFAALTLPLRSRRELTIGAFFSDSNAENVGGVEALDLDGESYQTTLDYRMARPERRGWNQDWVFGFDFKSSNSNLEFGLEEVFDTTTQIFQFRVGWEGEIERPRSETTVRAWVAFSLGEWTDGHSDAAFNASRAGADSSYALGQLDIDRTWKLPANWELETALGLQAATSNLLASEQAALSGTYAVRGFENSAVRGDHAVVARVQLNAPPMSADQLPGPGLAARPFFFVDGGWGQSAEPAGSEPDISLASLGLGLRGSIGEKAFLDAGYGWQIGQSGFEDNESGRFHLRATLRW